MKLLGAIGATFADSDTWKGVGTGGLFGVITLAGVQQLVSIMVGLFSIGFICFQICRKLKGEE